jgi:hypothetical protein
VSLSLASSVIYVPTQYDWRFRQAENKVAVLQERFDAQTITLRLAKEHSGDLQVCSPSFGVFLPGLFFFIGAASCF